MEISVLTQDRKLLKARVVYATKKGPWIVTKTILKDSSWAITYWGDEKVSIKTSSQFDTGAKGLALPLWHEYNQKKIIKLCAQLNKKPTTLKDLEASKEFRTAIFSTGVFPTL